MDNDPKIYREIDNKLIQVEGEIYWEAKSVRDDISDVKSTMDV